MDVEQIKYLAKLRPAPYMMTFSRARLAEHTRMTADELLNLMEQHKTKTVNVDTKESIVFELFYSEKDKQFFIAVQSATSGGVITIHTIDPTGEYPTARQKRKALVKMGYTDKQALEMAPNPPEETKQL